MKFTATTKVLKLILFFAGFFPALMLNAQVIDKIIAKVDNQIVLKSEYDQAYAQMTAQKQSFMSRDIRCSVIETLIINKLMLAKAEIDSVTVDRDAVDSELDRRMDYFVAQVGGDPKKLEEYYGKTLDQLKIELRKMVREQMIIQKMQEEITQKAKITPAEVKKFFNEIPSDSLPFFSTEVEVGQIVIIPEISREQKREAKELAQQIRERILAGEDFCALAKTYSEDPGSAENCGVIGWFQKGQLVTPYEGAALSLKEGETSPVTESEYGFHVIQLLERRGNEFNTRHILIKPSTTSEDIESSSKFLDSLRTQILSDSISFEMAAYKYSDDKATKSTGGLFSDPEFGGSKIPLENLDPAIFFIIDTMNVGGISKPLPYRIENETEAVRIIYYKTKIPPHKASLKDDYQKIYKAALSEKKNNEINQWFDNTKNEVFINVDPEFQDCDILITQ